MNSHAAASTDSAGVSIGPGLRTGSAARQPCGIPPGPQKFDVGIAETTTSAPSFLCRRCPACGQPCNRRDGDRTGGPSRMTNNVTDANEAQKRYWNTVAGPRWVANPGFRERRNQESLALLLDRLEITGGESVLEIGCGTGAVTLPLATAVGEQGRVVAVDISEPMLNAARQRVSDVRTAQCHAAARRRAGHGAGAGLIRYRDLAYGRHVLRRPGRGVSQHWQCTQTGRASRLCLLGGRLRRTGTG